MAGIYIYSHMAGGDYQAEDEDLDGQPAYELEIPAPLPERVRLLVKEKKVSEKALALSKANEPYWADLPYPERVQFYKKDVFSEIKRETSSIWATFKRDPLQPVRDYIQNYGIVGVGLFLEGYVIFSISNISTLFKHTYYECWSSFQICNKTWTEATTYMQLVGILIGQLLFGFMGDWVGRRTAMLTDMVLILLGVIMLTVANGTSEQGLVVMYAISQLVFGIGIGGEYPQTSTRATEESGEEKERGQRHRGRKVMLSYTMQGWGQFVNLGVLILLLLIFNSTGNPPVRTRANPHAEYSRAAMGAVWRVSFALLIPLVLYVIYYRIYVLQELQALAKAKKRANVKGYDWRSLGLLFQYYGHRLFGTSALWFLNDVYFYGNGVFRSTFVGILVGPDASILTNWLWSFLNAGIQLFGYYAAALTVDIKPWGRRRMTTFSFFMVFLLFLAAAVGYSHLVKPANIQYFQAIYYLSSFFGLFGSHTTSFLLAAESYPTSVRSTAHGISAASGKVGSIAVVVWFNYASTSGKFWIVWPAALTGAFVTWIFIADTTGMDLAEAERRWRYIRAGKAQDYHGPAVHPRHLSLWEKRVLGVHKQYNPERNREQRALAQKHGWDDDEAAMHAGEGI